MSFLLTVIGALLLLFSLAGVALGVYMAFGGHDRGRGASFALWWTPAGAASVGIVTRDSVTFVVGLLCFVVAGAAFVVQHHGSSQRPARTRSTTGSKLTGTGAGASASARSFYAGARRRVSEKIREYRKAAS